LLTWPKKTPKLAWTNQGGIMSTKMRAMVFDGECPILAERFVHIPVPGAGEVRIRVTACGVCRTDLHVVDGELAAPKPALIPGHEIVGRVDALGPSVVGLSIGERVGVPWLGHTCGQCRFCLSGRENLCDTPQFHGYTRDGGYAEYVVADASYCFHLPASYDDEHAAPLLCAGLIGFRTLRMAGNAERIGIYGFGAAAHIVTQIAVAQGRTVYAFTRPGDFAAQTLATDVGAAWAGSSQDKAPATIDAALIFAPDGALVPTALAAIDKGGTVVCGGIHMSDIPSFPYRQLWEERRIVSVANLTRADGHGLMEAAAAWPLHIRTTPYPLASANVALDDLRAGRLAGAAVLRI
jgi:propanol-preferring alcohol dehydrogenase